MLAALVDIFLTVLYARSGTSLLSGRLHRWTWRLFRCTALSWAPRKDQLLAFAGPVLLLLTVVVWVVLLSLGFSLIIWPLLGTGVKATTGETPTDFAAALYYAGYNLTTLGTGDLVPQTGAYRLLSVFMAATGFSILTLSLTFFTSVYSALLRRNTFALGLRHRTADTADATVLLSRLLPGGEMADARQELTAMSEALINLYESHHFYPVLHYFRFQETSYALARIALLTLDTVSLICSALDEPTYRPLVRSAAVAVLWSGGLQLLEGVSASFLPRPQPAQLRPDELEPEDERRWRAHFEGAVEKLCAGGITVVGDLDAGAAHYIALRRQWGPYVVAFAAYMAYDWDEVAVQETGEAV